MSYKTYLEREPTQGEQAHPSQIQNSAGGFSFKINDWDRLNRFLVLGTEGGSYYATQKLLTESNAATVKRLIAEDGVRVVQQIVEISNSGRAPKNDPALFALAMTVVYGNDNTRKEAYKSLRKVARIPTHLFHFLEYTKSMGKGWSRGLRNAISNWYNDDPTIIAYHAIKYRQRDGWSHLDVLRLSHVKPATSVHSDIFSWIKSGWESVGDDPHPDQALRILWGFEKAKRATTIQEITTLIRNENLPREALATEWLKSPEVWEALLQRMPMTALIRNLSVMTNVGLIKPLSDAEALVIRKLQSAEAIAKARIHPLGILVALNVYKDNEKASQRVIDTLNDAFYLAFGTVESTNKRTLLALDVSGSMSWNEIAGMKGITPAIGSAAMALVTSSVEPKYHIMAFADTLRQVSISPKQRLDDVVNQLKRISFGNTDCSLPMIWASQNNVQVDTFVVYTDNETWAGYIHPHIALEKYRQKTGIPSKLVVVGMISNEVSIAKPDDAGMMDVVGFDTSAPSVISNFSLGR
jgi:60 kDa SS-A/Ro ribonucleoprotein